jgi:hypothetical protein
MPDESVQIGVAVPPEGLFPYAFHGLDYVHNDPIADRRTSWTVGRGVPLPAGKVTDLSVLRLIDAAGTAVPTQTRSLASWPDGSVMFVHLSFQADLANDAPAAFELRFDGTGDTPAAKNPVTVEQTDTCTSVDNGVARIEIGTANEHPTLRMTVGDAAVFDGLLDVWTANADGARFSGTVDDVRVTQSGPITAIVEVSGRHRDAGGEVFLDYLVELRLDAGRADLRMAHTFLNMGDEADGVVVGEVGVRLSSAGEKVTHVVNQVGSGQWSFPRMYEVAEDVEINIDGAGGRLANVASLREDTSEYPPYLMHNRDLVKQYIGMRGNGWAAVATLHEATENCPKRITATGGDIVFHMWPHDAKLPVLRQGMARRHETTIAILPADVSAVEMHKVYHQWQAPANVTIPFPWFQQCRVLGMEYTLDWMPLRYRHLEANLAATIERTWVTGMFAYGDDPCSSYGDVYALTGLGDHAVWINNEHDFMAQAVTQYWRSNRPGAWRSARVSAQHQVDVDFVRRSDDLWKVGGIPAHSAGHTSASVYPSHTWTEGLLQYYLTSGDDRALEVACSLARNLCKYVEEGIEALRIEDRMIGWALIALNGVIEITGDERCLRAAQTMRDEVAEVVARNGTYDCTGMGYGTGTVLSGLTGLHRITGDAVALELVVTILDWHMTNSRNDVGTAWGDQLEPYDLNLTLPVYAYLWYNTGERRFLEEGIDFFRFTGAPVAAGGQVRSAGKHYRTYIGFLKMAHDAGVLEQMTEPPPFIVPPDLKPEI